ncbi:condensation domain-containing protein [Kitasatospora sp. NPDC058190]|uniref:condensation domain-containing protein n=1 Tax=Kitasatospora sp. NPDC058190 TaxID=3346371 RepID=UPI0036D8DFEA
MRPTCFPGRPHRRPRAGDRIPGHQPLCSRTGWPRRVLRQRAGAAPGRVPTAVLHRPAAQAREVVADAQAHKGLPFADLVRTLVSEPEPAHAPLFQAMFNLVPAPAPAGTGGAAERGGTGGLDMTMRQNSTGTVRFDLSLAVRETDSHLEGYLEYSTDLFARGTAESLVRGYVDLLELIVRRPDADLARPARRSEGTEGAA